ncbi:hypothetical protein N9Z91_00660 [Akkermansiaceae bacterium]|nr:hypothetical protein [bacterium]MDA7527096.1 hypothetical protein [Akkermansiaceae bacterium]MDA7625582.1 hypothetical protein [bacterium]MDB4361610.1 hypothetical protein [Akkermansiaceae bacterium]MDB4398237.1 hypothetical protein [Akkermansiaceae bacterium]
MISIRVLVLWGCSFIHNGTAGRTGVPTTEQLPIGFAADCRGVDLKNGASEKGIFDT